MAQQDQGNQLAEALARIDQLEHWQTQHDLQTRVASKRLEEWCLLFTDRVSNGIQQARNEREAVRRLAVALGQVLGVALGQPCEELPPLPDPPDLTDR